MLPPWKSALATSFRSFQRKNMNDENSRSALRDRTLSLNHQFSTEVGLGKTMKTEHIFKIHAQWRTRFDAFWGRPLSNLHASPMLRENLSKFSRFSAQLSKISELYSFFTRESRKFLFLTHMSGKFLFNNKKFCLVYKTWRKKLGIE